MCTLQSIISHSAKNVGPVVYHVLYINYYIACYVISNMVRVYIYICVYIYIYIHEHTSPGWQSADCTLSSLTSCCAGTTSRARTPAGFGIWEFGFWGCGCGTSG